MKKILVIAALLVFPGVASAQLGNIIQLTQSLGTIIDLLIPIAAAAALLFFFYGLAKFVLNAGNDEARDSGKKVMIWGIVALFVLSSVWGLVFFLRQTFNIGNQTGSPIPTIGGFGN